MKEISSIFLPCRRSGERERRFASSRTVPNVGILTELHENKASSNSELGFEMHVLGWGLSVREDFFCSMGNVDMVMMWLSESLTYLSIINRIRKQYLFFSGCVLRDRSARVSNCSLMGMTASDTGFWMYARLFFGFLQCLGS